MNDQRNFFLLFIVLLISRISSGQNAAIDSLLSLLKTDKEDTLKVTHFSRLCDEYRVRGEYEKGLFYGNAALELGKKTGFLNGLHNAYNNIGIIYKSRGDYDKALENYFASLKIREEIKDKKGIATSYNNIGIVYGEEGNSNKALEYHTAALKMRKEAGDKKGIAGSYNNIGAIYEQTGNYDKALESYFAALKINTEMQNRQWIANNYGNIGSIYQTQGALDKALKNYFTILKIFEEIGDKPGMAMCYNNIGTVFFKQKKISEARDKALMNLDISKKTGSKEDMKDGYLLLSLCDSASGNWKDAYEHQKLFKLYNDSIFKEGSLRKAAEIDAKHESEKQEAQIKLLEKDKEKQTAITAEENKKHKVILWSVIGGLLLLIVFSAFMFNRWRVTQKQKKVIEEQKHVVDAQKKIVEDKQKEILASIYYARRIQRSLLTNEKYMERTLKTLKKNHN